MKHNPKEKRSDLRVLVIGEGGREHALAWALCLSPSVAQVFTCPGNAGTARLGTQWGIRGASALPYRQELLAEICVGESIDLVVVGPEEHLVLGIADTLRRHGVAVFGPTHKAARIELKDFAKGIMREAGIPTARAERFTSAAAAVAAIRNGPQEIVVKAVGLMGGKGVTVAESREEAEAAVRRAFEANQAAVLLEERLRGKEISAHAFCDGERVAMFPVAEDHKRAGEGDVGPNTGGMGAVTRHDLAGLLPEIEERIVAPMARALRQRGDPFRGVLYPGIMLTDDGPKVIEWNCRLGDPEAQAYLPILDADLGQICLDCAQGRLDPASVKWFQDSAAAIVVATSGYPDAGDEIVGPICSFPDARVTNLFHGRTFIQRGELWVRSGRALTAVGISRHLDFAIRVAAEAAGQISFPGAWFRKDVGARALAEMAAKEVTA